MHLKFKDLLRGIATAAFVLVGTTASAITVTADYTKSPNFTAGDTVAKVDCGGQCLGWDGSGWSATTALLYAPLSNSKPTSEINAINALLGTSYTAASFTKQSNPGNTFTVSGNPYILVKTGKGYSIFKNLASSVDYIWTPGKGTGTGVSHVSAVPLPATLPLLLAGMGGLGIAGWRRKKRKA